MLKKLWQIVKCIFSYKPFEATIENTHGGKVKQMQPMRLCILSGMQFEETCENAQRRKVKKCNQCDYVFSYASALRRHLKKHSGEVKQMLPVWLCILSGNPFEDKSQCDYASSNASSFMMHLKSHRGEKSNKCNQCDYGSYNASDLRKRLNKLSGFSEYFSGFS